MNQFTNYSKSANPVPLFFPAFLIKKPDLVLKTQNNLLPLNHFRRPNSQIFQALTNLSNYFKSIIEMASQQSEHEKSRFCHHWASGDCTFGEECANSQGHHPNADPTLQGSEHGDMLSTELGVACQRCLTLLLPVSSIRIRYG